MKILLVGNYALDGQTSMLRFVDVLATGLAARGLEVRVLAPQPVLFPKTMRIDGPWKWIGYVNKFLLFPASLRRAAKDADVVHICDHSNAMYVRSVRTRRHLVTCHDVIAIRAARGLDRGWKVGATGRLFQHLILTGLRSARRIACVSELTREQLVALAPETRAVATVVHNGLNFPFAPAPAAGVSATLASLGIADAPYLLHVGSGHRRKNRAHLVRTFRALRARLPGLPHRLVLVGAPLSEDVAPLVDSLGLRDCVLGLTEVDNEQLGAVYTGATALIFPSLYEGFGWPVIEAQACGCPVFVANLRPMTDIGGAAAIPIDPLDPEAAAAVIAQRLPTLAELRASSLQNAARFTTDAMIDGYLALYRELTATPGAGRAVGAAHRAGP